MNSTEYDVIVIGAGINGSWSALHLAKQGFKTVLIDQFPLPHSRGSSHGQSRGIRTAYKEPFLAAMMADAFQQWKDLEKESGVHLFKNNGLMTFGTRYNAYFDGVLNSFRKLKNSPFEVFMPNELAEKYPNLTMGENIWGLLDPTAGILFSDKALGAVWKMYTNHGGKIIDNCPIDKIYPENSKSVRVKLVNGQIIQSKSLVICAGPWTNKVLEPLSWKMPLTPIKISVFYYKHDGHIPQNFYYSDDIDEIWGLGENEYPGLTKICLMTGPKINPDSRDIVDNSDDKAHLHEFIAKKFPKVDPNPSIEESCIYTVSPDNVHILDKHPKYPNIVVGCGFSGSGFKLGPVTGEFLANMATGKPTKFDPKPFLLSRFQPQIISINKSASMKSNL